MFYCHGEKSRSGDEATSFLPFAEGIASLPSVARNDLSAQAGGMTSGGRYRIFQHPFKPAW